jgi:hypothetical protein
MLSITDMLTKKTIHMYLTEAYPLHSINLSKVWYLEMQVTFKHHLLWLFSVESGKGNIVAIQVEKLTISDYNIGGLRQNS